MTLRSTALALTVGLGVLLAVACSDDRDVSPCPQPTASEQAVYAACVATTGKADCEGTGGTWTSLQHCSCPTGRENCRCSGPDDCLGGCIHELAGQPDPPTSCSGVTQGRCRGFGPPAGCGCWFEPTPEYRCWQ